MSCLGNILLVEDNNSICSVYAHILEDTGYFIKYANNGKYALECFKSTPFEVILCDFNLPDIDGIKLIKKIKEMDRDIYSILFTASSSDEIEASALVSGIDDFILKPCNEGRLLIGIKRGLEIRKDRIYKRAIGEKLLELSYLTEEYIGRGIKGY